MIPEALGTLLLNPGTYVTLFTLTLLEVVLGIDNIIFISILVGKLPPERRQKSRVFGLSLAVVARIILLSCIFWLSKLTEPLFTVFDIGISIRDMVMLFGGLFLIFKSAQEMYENVELPQNEKTAPDLSQAGMMAILVQIILIDLVFSFDSILTAIGLAQEILIMALAIIASLGVMIWASQPIGDFIDRHLSVKVLALSFLLMIGTLLVAEAFHFHIPKEYVYFSLAFSLFVEAVNIKARGKRATLDTPRPD